MLNEEKSVHGEAVQDESASGGENENSNQTPGPDPTRYVVQRNRHLPIPSKSWIIFIAANILIPVVFAATYINLTQNNKTGETSNIPIPSPTQSPSPISDTTAIWKTYTNTAAKYSLKYPSDYTLNEGKVAGVDGVVSKAPTFIQLISSPIPNTSGNFAITINYLATSANLDDFVDKNSNCVDIKAVKGKPYILDGTNSSIFVNSPCGPWGSTEIYTIKNGLGYIIKIEGTVSEAEMKPYYEQILSTFRFD